MSWNPSQQAMLEAMGYTLYRQAGVALAATASATAPAPAPGASAVRPDSPADPAPAPADKLMQALCRAAGGRDLAGIPLPPLDQLRRSAQAKRALWPRLRALRRS